MQMTEDQASMVEVARQPEGGVAVEGYHPDHQPDYTATIDHGTSTYSPVPKRVMNGSEPGETTPAAVLSGAPVDLQARTVRYAPPPKKDSENPPPNPALREKQNTPQGFGPELRCRSANNELFFLVLLGSTNRSDLPHNPGRGVVTPGGWTGTLCPKVTGGRIR